MISTHDVRQDDGRVLRAYDTGPAAAAPALIWHTGSPQTGALLDPLVAAAAQRGIRLVSYARPSYGPSTPAPGRDVAAAAADVARIADALGIARFMTMGASGGGPHALACAAVLGRRVTGVATLAGLAPFTDEYDWFAGMAAPGGLRAAREGREARARFAEVEEFDRQAFTEADWAALAGDWASLATDAGRAVTAGSDGLIDDDVAFAAPWGFALEDVAAPVLVVQGGQDRVVPPIHARALVAGCPQAELWVRPDDGHVSVLDACPAAMDWLVTA